MWKPTWLTPLVIILAAVLGGVALVRHQWLYAALLIGFGIARAYVLVRPPSRRSP